ncbi:MAG: hypothetical protein V9E88_14180 [Ferruginibacter sp.]
MNSADIVLRPTNTDGDALTIREAIYLNKKIVASDVVERPEGTILFKTRDTNDLEIKIEAAIEQDNQVNGKINKEEENYYKKYYTRPDL